MAKAPTVTVLMGASLLTAIAAGAVAGITQDQAASLDASHFTVDTAAVVDGVAPVTLTEAGVAAAAALAAPAAAAPKAGGYAIDDGVPMPSKARRGRTSEPVYPFDALAVGQSFHVPKTAENPDPSIRLSSSVSGARVKYSPVIMGEDGQPVMETYQVKVYQTGEDGKPVKGADGKRIVAENATKTREKRGEPERDFRVVSVDASDPRGAGARVFRTK